MSNHTPSRTFAVSGLPTSEADPRAGETALAVALGGLMCPVPFVMSAAAMKIAGSRNSRRTSIAVWLALVTIVLQASALTVSIVLFVC